MKLRSLKSDQKGIMAMMGMVAGAIITLFFLIIVLYQLFISPVGPTTHMYLHDNVENTSYYGKECDLGDIENIDNTSTWKYNPGYDASALGAWNNLQTITWAIVAILGVVILVIALMPVIQIMSGGLGKGKV